MQLAHAAVVVRGGSTHRPPRPRGRRLARRSDAVHRATARATSTSSGLIEAHPRDAARRHRPVRGAVQPGRAADAAAARSVRAAGGAGLLFGGQRPAPVALAVPRDRATVLRARRRRPRAEPDVPRILRARGFTRQPVDGDPARRRRRAVRQSATPLCHCRTFHDRASASSAASSPSKGWTCCSTPPTPARRQRRW